MANHILVKTWGVADRCQWTSYTIWQTEQSTGVNDMTVVTKLATVIAQ